eukprot:evm.model.scf_1069.1 EVM.evm.TU.scf_1069.1   scf_1069:4079-8480(+)
MAVGSDLWRLAGLLVTILAACRGSGNFALGRQEVAPVSPQNSAAGMSPDMPRTLGRNGVGRMPLDLPLYFSPDRLQELGLPNGADVLFLAASNCPQTLPVQYEGRAFLMCNTFQSIRTCLNRTAREPLFHYKNCSRALHGCEPLLVTNEQATCTSENVFGFLSENASEEARCGVPKDLWLLFEPAVNPYDLPVLDDPLSICYVSNPHSSNRTIQAVCSEDRPHWVYKWNFDFPEDADDGVYSCILDRQCLDTPPCEISLCYRERQGASLTGYATTRARKLQQNAEFRHRDVSGASGAHSTCFARLSWIPLLAVSAIFFHI